MKQPAVVAVFGERLPDLVIGVIITLVLAFIELAPDLFQVGSDPGQVFIERLSLLFGQLVTFYDHRSALVESAVLFEAVTGVDARVAAPALGGGVGKGLELLIGKAQDELPFFGSERSHEIYFTDQSGQVRPGEQRPVADDQEVFVLEAFPQCIQILQGLFLIGGIAG